MAVITQVRILVMAVVFSLFFFYYLSHLPHRSSNKALLKVAHMSAILQNYKKAADLFEDVRAVHVCRGLLVRGFSY